MMSWLLVGWLVGFLGSGEKEEEEEEGKGKERKGKDRIIWKIELIDWID